MDFKMTGSLRTVVVVANGLRSCGSRCTADSTTIRIPAAAAATTTPASDPTLGMRAMAFPRVRAGALQLPRRVQIIRGAYAYCAGGGKTHEHGQVPVRPARGLRVWRAAALAEVQGGRLPAVDHAPSGAAHRVVGVVRRLPEGHSGQGLGLWFGGGLGAGGPPAPHVAGGGSAEPMVVTA